MAVMKAMDLLVRILGQQFKTELKAEVVKELTLQVKPLIELAACKAVQQCEQELHSSYSPARMREQVFISLLVNDKGIDVEKALEAIEADRGGNN